RFMGYSLLRGARAALVGMGSACVTVQAELIDAALDWKSRPQRFLELCLQVDALAERTFVDPMEGYIQRMMWCLAHHGILDRSQTHDPWGPKLPDAEFETLGDFL